MNSIYKRINKSLVFILVAIKIFINLGCINKKINISLNNNIFENAVIHIDEDNSYTTKEDVSLYIYVYKKLPHNFITKKEAKKLGWNNKKNTIDEIAKGKSIGGDIYNNYEKLLPIVNNRIYYECDIDYHGGKRNSKRIVYTLDFDEKYGYVFYTDNHYKTFERLY